MHSRSARFVAGKVWFPLSLLFLVFFKLWLVHTEEIYGLTGEYDNLWYLKSAQNWYWGAPYSWTAFFRPPAYPLFIAFVHMLGMPLRIAIELLQMGGFLVLIAALRAVGVPRTVSFAIFALSTLHPCSFQLNNYSISDTFYAAILIYLVGGLIFALQRRSRLASVGAGIAFGILWNTREENLLLPLIFAVYATLALIRQFRQTHAWKAAFRSVLDPIGAMLVSATLLILAALIANHHTFGSFAKSEMMSRSFRAAHRALVRIKPSHSQRYVLVSREARETAYAVSPTFARLKDSFESQLGHRWEAGARDIYGIPNEIDAGVFRFALSNVASAIGVYRDPSTAHRFYKKVADEINRACDEGRIPSRFVFDPFLDPEVGQTIPFLPQSFCRVVKVFSRQYAVSQDREDAVLRPPNRAVYDKMANRREALTRIGVLRLVGWGFQVGEPLAIVGYDSGGGEIESGMTHFSPRPDVVEVFKSRGDVPLRTEFGLPIPLRRGSIPEGDLIFITESGRKYIGSVASVVAGNPPRENGVAGGTPLTCKIFAQEFTPSAISFSTAVTSWIGKYHHHLVLGLTYLGAISGVVLAARFRRLQLSDLNAVLTLLVVIIGSRVLLITYLDATTFPGDDPRFLFPVMPLYSALLCLLIYYGIRSLPVQSRFSKLATSRATEASRSSTKY